MAKAATKTKPRSKKVANTTSLIDDIPSDDIAYTDMLVIGSKPTFDAGMNCNGYQVRSGNGVSIFIPNPTDNPENAAKVSDLIRVYQNNNIVRGVVKENKNVWFYFRPYRSAKDVLNQIRKMRVATLKEKEGEIIPRLDAMAESLPDVYKLRVDFWRNYVPDFRFLYEEREITLLQQCAKIDVAFRKIYNNDTYAMIQNIRSYGLAQVQQKYPTLVDGLGALEQDMITTVLRSVWDKSSFGFFIYISPHVQNDPKIKDRAETIDKLTKWAAAKGLEMAMDAQGRMAPKIF